MLDEDTEEGSLVVTSMQNIETPLPPAEQGVTSQTALTPAEQRYLEASGGKISSKDPLGKLINAKLKRARKEENKRREEYNTRMRAKKIQDTLQASLYETTAASRR